MSMHKVREYWETQMHRDLLAALTPHANGREVRVDSDDNGRYSFGYRKDNGWWKTWIIPHGVNNSASPDPVVRLSAFMQLIPNEYKLYSQKERIDWAIATLKAELNVT